MSNTNQDVVIENVADVIREVINTFKGGRRWVKDSFGPEKAALGAADANYCLIGGIRAVLGNGDQYAGRQHPLYRDTVALVTKTIRPKAKTFSSGTIIKFNDSKRTNFDRVEAILAAALVKARQFAGVA